MSSPTPPETEFAPPADRAGAPAGSAGLRDPEVQYARDVAALRLSERLGRSFNGLFIPMALLSTALLLPHVDGRRLGLWVVLYATFLGARQLARHASVRSGAPRIGPPLGMASVIGAANAALLGSLAWLSHDLLPLSSHLMLTVLMVTLAALFTGLCHDFTAILRAYLVLMLGPFAIGWFASPQPLSWVVGTSLVVLALVLEASACHLRCASLVRAQLQVDNQRLSRNLAARVADLDTLNRSKTRLLAAASHDLRQPAHAMGMTIDSMLAQPHENLLPRLQLLQRSNTRLVGMLATLMDLARLDSGSFDALPTAIELDEVMEEARLQLQDAAEQKGLALRVHASGLRGMSDAYLLRRMLLNLGGNAVKYTAQGSVTLSAHRDGAEGAQGAQVVLSVADTGVGIPAPLQAGVFEDYTRLERSGEGLGIGLAVVRAACALLGHEVRLTSAPARGTTVSITLPLAPAAPTAPAVASPWRVAEVSPPYANPASAAHAADPFTTAGTRTGMDTEAPLVALAEDDTEACRATTILLRSWGYDVVSAPAVAPLLAELSRAGRAPVLLLTDLHLLNCTGFDVARAVRALPALAALPVLMLTGDLDPAARRHAQAQSIALLHKPAPSRRLREALTELLGLTPQAPMP